MRGKKKEKRGMGDKEKKRERKKGKERRGSRGGGHIKERKRNLTS